MKSYRYDEKYLYLLGSVTEVTRFWDDLQQEHSCCGTTSYTEWQLVFNVTDVPDSCCKVEFRHRRRINTEAKARRRLSLLYLKNRMNYTRMI